MYTTVMPIHMLPLGRGEKERGRRKGGEGKGEKEVIIIQGHRNSPYLALWRLRSLDPEGISPA